MHKPKSVKPFWGAINSTKPHLKKKIELLRVGLLQTKIKEKPNKIMVKKSVKGRLRLPGSGHPFAEFRAAREGTFVEPRVGVYRYRTTLQILDVDWNHNRFQ